MDWLLTHWEDVTDGMIYGGMLLGFALAVVASLAALAAMFLPAAGIVAAFAGIFSMIAILTALFGMVIHD